jgi:D-threo-aldose 1-dehydrogenase
MKFLCDQHLPFGKTGLAIPPIVFGTAALGNANRVIPELTKLAICGEWFRGVAPPVFIDAAYRHGNGMALEQLGRVLRRLDIASEEIVIGLELDGEQSPSDAGQPKYDRLMECWVKSRRLLGEAYRPKLVSVGDADVDAWRAASELKDAKEVLGAGIGIKDWRAARDYIATIEPDWITLTGGCTLMRHSPEMLAFMAELARRQIPIVVAGAFDGGFLVGGNQLDGRVVSADDPADRALFAWRKAFVALCEGHGISPAHACIQFALTAPGVVAVLLKSSYPDRVAENVNSVCQRVPDNLWASMKEEGLLAADVSCR